MNIEVDCACARHETCARVCVCAPATIEDRICMIPAIHDRDLSVYVPDTIDDRIL